MSQSVSARRLVLAVSMLLLCGTAVIASMPDAAPAPSVNVSVPVVSYGSGAVSKVELKPTSQGQRAAGQAKLSQSKGSMSVAVSVKGLPAATSFGPEYQTYVVWAVTSEGRPRNLGEIIVDKSGKGKFEASTQSPSFGIVVTAEPYFAVGSPSEIVVLRNEFSGKDATKAAATDVQFQAFAKDTFAGASLTPPDPKSKLPMDLYQARNAVRIAEKFGAKTYATDAYTRAAQALEQAESLATDKKKKEMAGPKAREAVQSAEAARALSVRNIADARVAAEKAEADARAKAAQAAAADEARRRAQAEESADMARASAADEARRRAVAEQSAAQSEAARRQAEADKQALRARLLQQFNVILETRDSARGLIVNLGGVLFDLNKSTLRPEAREKLAKLSGILLAHPGLKLDIEGHTDATGSDEYNQKLSEDRAGSVRDYLVEQKVGADMIAATGFGKTKPVASNDTEEGRKANRRVEIVVSGDIIGTEVSQEKAAAGDR